MCKSCVNWKFETAETWGLRFDNTEGFHLLDFPFGTIVHNNCQFLGGKLKPFKPIITNAAMWEPTLGFIHHDRLFPHIEQGFRNRTVPIAVFNVSECLK